MDKRIGGVLEASSDFADSQDALRFLKKLSFTQLEKIPELRDLAAKVLSEAETERRILESINALSQTEVHKLFRTYIESHFDSYLQSFFDSLEKGLRVVVKNTVQRSLEKIEAGLREISNEILLAQISPYALVDSKIIQGTVEFLSVQPGYQETIHAVYKYLAYKVRVIIPGATLTDKYVYLLKLLRRTECFKEWNGFQIELLVKEFKDDVEALVQDREYREKLLKVLEEAEQSSKEKGENQTCPGPSSPENISTPT